MEKRTPKGWTEYLAQEENPVTLSEYMAACLSRILGCMVETAQATGHAEGMLGRFETYLQRRDRLFGLSTPEADALLAREDVERERAAIQEAGRLRPGGGNAV
jgi:hypothetical protein